MLQGLAVGVLGSLVGNTLAEALKDKGSASATEGFQIASLGKAKAAGEDESPYMEEMDEETKAALESLREMTSGGIEGFWQWMMKELRKDVMEEMGVSEASLAAMDPEQRAATENAIEEEVQKRLKQAMGVGEEGETPQKLTELVEKMKQAMQTAQGSGYKDEAKGLLEFL